MTTDKTSYNSAIIFGSFLEVCYNSRLANIYRRLHDGRVAQSVEQRIENPRVTGSIPVPATSI